MSGTTGKTLLIAVILTLLLAACSDSATPQTIDQQSATHAPTVESDSAPQSTVEPEPTMTMEEIGAAADSTDSEPTPVVELTPGKPPGVQTMEAVLAPPPADLGDLETYLHESTGISFDYPAGWIVTEDSATIILVESEAGYADRLDADAGAAVIIISMAADDIPGQDSLEKLAAFVNSKGTPPSSGLGDPTTVMVNNQELTFAPFVDESAEHEGIYAAYLQGDDLVVVFAVASGVGHIAYRPAFEAIVNSIILPQAE